MEKLNTKKLTQRDKVALEFAKQFTLNQGKYRTTLKNKIKFYLGFSKWKAIHDYNYEDICEQSYKIADIFINESKLKLK